MKTLTKTELLEKLNNVRGATFATIETITKPKVKSGSPVIEKRSRVNGTIGYNYTNSVNNQREREEKETNFLAANRVWGTRLNSVLVKNGNNHYLNIKVEKSQKPEYFSAGQRIADHIVNKFLSSVSTSSRQDLDKEVVVRNYNIDNIVKITMDGETYDVV